MKYLLFGITGSPLIAIAVGIIGFIVLNRMLGIHA